jgi:hypothetical protein
MNLLADQSVRVIENFGHVSYADHTTLHPVGFTMLVLCCTALLCVPRRLALVPILVMGLLIPSAQRIVLFSLDFHFLRILILVGLLRVLMRREYDGIVWWKLDAVVVAWGLVLFAISGIRTGGELLVMQSGLTVDAIGGYLVMRCVLRDWDDVAVAASTAAIMSLPMAMAFLFEQKTQYNLFSLFGGVKEITTVRDDRLRCMGPYNHPILAGCIWASLAPLCAGLWARGWIGKLQAMIGTCCSLIIVYCCASSTPVFGVLVGIIGFASLPLRNYTRAIRWGSFGALIGLHMAMKAPVWHLICRVSAVGGSTGYHRFKLIDSFIWRFPEWALMGTGGTAHWFWGGQDVTNHFVIQGVNGGFLTFFLFVASVALSFGAFGRARRSAVRNWPKELLTWGLGVGLLVHCACFIGVSYFGQANVLWYLTLAAAGSLHAVTVTAPSNAAGHAKVRWFVQAPHAFTPVPAP